MTFRNIAAVALAATLLATQAFAAPLPVTKHKLAEKTKFYDIEVDYPLTGVKAIDDDLVASVKTYVRDYENLSKGSYLEQDGADLLQTDFKIVRNDAQVFAVLFTSEMDEHGAHPNMDLWTANYFRSDGWRFYLPELYDARALPVISRLVIADLDRRIASGPDAESEPDTVKAGAGPLARNFAVFAPMPDRIHFWFPPYQVASYAAGPQESQIPLAALAPFARTNPRAPAASFDCGLAKRAIEIAICSDVALARLDRSVADEYGNNRDNSGGDKVAQRAAERAWLAQRNQTCNGRTGASLVACLTAVYKARAQQLNPEQ